MTTSLGLPSTSAPSPGEENDGSSTLLKLAVDAIDPRRLLTCDAMELRRLTCDAMELRRLVRPSINACIVRRFSNGVKLSSDMILFIEFRRSCCRRCSSNSCSDDTDKEDELVVFVFAAAAVAPTASTLGISSLSTSIF
jgi:hypothetical protein